MPQSWDLAAEKEKPVRIDSARFFCVSVCISACVCEGRFVRLLTRYMLLLVLLIAMRRLFIVDRSLDRLGERLCMRCGRNRWRRWGSFSRCMKRHKHNDTETAEYRAYDAVIHEHA